MHYISLIFIQFYAPFLQVRVRTINKQEAEKMEHDHNMDEKTEMRARELEEKVKKQLESLGLDVKSLYLFVNFFS